MSVSLGRATALSALVTVVCFVVAGAVGQHQDGWVGDPLPQWLGDVAWIGLLLGVLVTVLLGVALLVRRLTGRGAAGGDSAVS